MLRSIALCLAFALSGFARADEGSVSVQITTSEGKPAAGVKAWVYDYSGIDKVQMEPVQLVADADGRITVPSSKGTSRSRQLFARDDAGRMGWSALNAPWDDPGEDRSVEVVLVECGSRQGRVISPEGKPVVGALVTPLMYSVKEGKGSREGPAETISLPAWEEKRLSVTTDNDGRFKLVAPMAGYSVFYQVKAPGFGESRWTAPPQVEIITPLTIPGELLVTFEGMDPLHLKGCDWALNARTVFDGKTDANPLEISPCDPSRLLIKFYLVLFPGRRLSSIAG